MYVMLVQYAYIFSFSANTPYNTNTTGANVIINDSHHASTVAVNVDPENSYSSANNRCNDATINSHQI